MSEETNVWEPVGSILSDRLFGIYAERLNGGGVLLTHTREGDAARGSYLRQAFTSPKLFREEIGKLSNELFDE